MIYETIRKYINKLVRTNRKQFEFGKEPEKQQLFVAPCACKKGWNVDPRDIKRGEGRAREGQPIRVAARLFVYNLILSEGNFQAWDWVERIKRTNWVGAQVQIVVRQGLSPRRRLLGRLVGPCHCCTLQRPFTLSIVSCFCRKGVVRHPLPPCYRFIREGATFLSAAQWYFGVCELLWRIRFAVGRCYGLPSVTWLCSGWLCWAPADSVVWQCQRMANLVTPTHLLPRYVTQNCQPFLITLLSKHFNKLKNVLLETPFRISNLEMFLTQVPTPWFTIFVRFSSSSS